MAGRYRPRREFKFWLFMDKQEESRLVDFIEYCKKTRSFSRVVRNGIRLMWSLGEGDTSVLFELFPGLRTQLVPVVKPDTDNLERQILDLKKLILEQNANGGRALPAADKPSKLQKSIVMPLFDDDDDNDTVVINKASSSKLNGGNLLSGIFGLGD